MKYSEKINNYLRSKTDSSLSFSSFLSYLKNRGKAVIVGGAIRDIVYYHKQPRDIDFIFWGDLSNLISTINISATQNRFGGYKILFNNNLEVDIWEASDNWAFKNHFFKKSIENIHLGCLYNYDSLVWSLNNDYYEDQFFKEFQEGKVLDFINEDKKYINDNPTPAINVLRALKIKKQHRVKLSSRVKGYIFNFTQKYGLNSVEKLMSAEFNHYHKSSWNRLEIESALNSVLPFGENGVLSHCQIST